MPINKKQDALTKIFSKENAAAHSGILCALRKAPLPLQAQSESGTKMAKKAILVLTSFFNISLVTASNSRIASRRAEFLFDAMRLKIL